MQWSFWLRTSLHYHSHQFMNVSQFCLVQSFFWSSAAISFSAYVSEIIDQCSVSSTISHDNFNFWFWLMFKANWSDILIQFSSLMMMLFWSMMIELFLIIIFLLFLQFWSELIFHNWLDKICQPNFCLILSMRSAVDW